MLTAESVLYREGVAGDVEALCRIEKDSFDTDLISRRQFRYHLAKASSYLIVAELNGRVVGYCLTFTSALTSRPARVYSLAVVPEVRGLAVGRELIGRSLAYLKSVGFRRVRLEVRANLPKLVAFYEGMGFQKIQLLPGYYQDGVDGFRLEILN